MKKKKVLGIMLAPLLASLLILTIAQALSAVPYTDFHDLLYASSSNLQAIVGFAYEPVNRPGLWLSLGELNPDFVDPWWDNNDFVPANGRLLVDIHDIKPLSEQILTVEFDTGSLSRIYVPSTYGTTEWLYLWVADDGSTYYDKEMTLLARATPAVSLGNLQILEPVNGSVIMGSATITFVIENMGDAVEFLQGDPRNRIDLEIEYRSNDGDIYGWGIMFWSTSYYGLTLFSGEKIEQTLVYDPSRYEGDVPPGFIGEAPYGEATIRLVHWKSLEPGYWLVGEFGLVEIHVIFKQMVVPAIIDFEPATLNLKSGGKWITVYLELPEGPNVSEIDISTVRLNDEIPADLHPIDIGDHDKDGSSDLMVKFSRRDLASILSAGENTLTITGEVNGRIFEGSCTIKVMERNRPPCI